MTPVWSLMDYLFWFSIKMYNKPTSTNRLLDAMLTSGVIVMHDAPFFMLTERMHGKTMTSFDIVMRYVFLTWWSFVVNVLTRLYVEDLLFTRSVVILSLYCVISFAGTEELIQSGIQATEGFPYRNDHVAVDMDQQENL